MKSANWPGPNRDVAMGTLREAADEPLDLVAVYGATSFDLFHVSDALSESCNDRASLVEIITELAEEMREEFVRHGLFSGLRPTQKRVEYKSSMLNGRKLLQVYCGGRGMVLLVHPDQREEPLVRAAMELLGV
ncbi:hypothetical protein [Halogeometricum luteum]|uniref:Roadblock/LAMTOR2 domain-containing protein n=1 Tax=Halogeometricum luteum TaxID=2950537 RepID=A0ABU2FXT5_9EURY|nr:hypothetical protein [Halogeometricum sp. S3BR5-2]MDS0293336.1 hypothetical protein [Halogeometricum sp. S3BR5-2]